MSIEVINIKTVASYSGHSVNQNKTVSLTLRFTYDTLTKYIQLVQLLNENIRIVAKLEQGLIELGNFNLNNIRIDKDGEAKIKFISQMDFIEFDNIAKLVDTDVFKILMTASVETEGNEKK